MYTGYFGKIKTYKKAGLIPVSICGKAPDWYTGHQYKKLAPKLGFFVEWSVGEHKGDNNYYIEHFKEDVLDTLRPEDVINELKQFGRLQDIILLCYEKPESFCHRHLVANWLNENGLYVTEF